MDNVKRVFLAGFQPQSESSFKMLSTIEDIFKKELAIKAQFLLVFEKPLQITDSRIVDKKKGKEYSVSEGDIFKDEDVWKKIARSYRVDLIITGKVGFSNQVGKDIIKVRKFRDGKEIQISKLVKKRFFKLDLTLYFINGDTGKIIHTEVVNKALGREEKTKESKDILLALLRKSVPGIKSLIVVKRKPMRRTLLN
jgi:hypothetical protein